MLESLNKKVSPHLLPLLASFQQPVLNLVVHTRDRDDVVHLLLGLGGSDLLQKLSLLIRRVVEDDPVLRGIVHLPRPGRDRLGRLGHSLILRVEE